MEQFNITDFLTRNGFCLLSESQCEIGCRLTIKALANKVSDEHQNLSKFTFWLFKMPNPKTGGYDIWLSSFKQEVIKGNVF